MGPDARRERITFFEVFSAEAEKINERREAVAEGKLAVARGCPHPETRVAPEAEKGVQPIPVLIRARKEAHPAGKDQPRRNERGQKVPRPEGRHNLTGLALSGGGVRSAAFCLGVLQGIDAHRENKDPQILDQIDYLSTVSGGGYIGISLVSGLVQSKGRFPFASKLDQEETPETQWLRDYSNFLVPNGGRDFLIGFVVILRGLIINAIAFLAIILLLAAAMVCLNPEPMSLGAGPTGGWLFQTTLLAVAAFLVWLIARALFVRVEPLRTRERRGHVISAFLVGVLLVALVEFQAYVILHLLDGSISQWFGETFPKVWAGLIPVAVALATFAGKLSAIARTTLGDMTWKGSMKRWSSLAALYLAAGIVPFLLFCLYIMACYWGIAGGMANSARAWHAVWCGWLGSPLGPGTHGGGLLAYYPFPFNAVATVSGWLAQAARLISSGVDVPRLCPRAPGWLMAAGAFTSSYVPFIPRENGIAAFYTIFGIAFAAISFLVRPNVGSLHGYYRDRLSRAFLWKEAQLADCVVGRNYVKRSSLWADFKALSLNAWNRIVDWANGIERMDPPDDVDRIKFSSLKKGGTVHFAPYLIVNTTVNIAASPYLSRRGRNADSFIFSPGHIGSEATDYAETISLEGIDSTINLGTAMAASGAAASANMGEQTIKPLTFAMSVLNVRLGYWIPNPRYQGWNGKPPFRASLGPLYYAMETLGWLDEDTQNVYLTDGGHFDNLGLYELLKRRCSLIIVVDAEADPAMDFNSFIRAQRYARIDLGTVMDVPWEALRSSALSLPGGGWHKSVALGQGLGPHVAVGAINYGPKETKPGAVDHGEKELGILIYIKASMSGDENDLIRDYKRRYPAFPHETTLDQFFSEEQFEVYRALGFHIAAGFLNGTDAFDTFAPDRYNGWLFQLDRMLKHINIAQAARAMIMERARKGPPRSAAGNSPHARGSGGPTSGAAE